MVSTRANTIDLASRTSWDDLMWEPLLASIERGRVIPVIGPELCCFRKGTENVAIETLVAHELAEQLGPIELQPGSVVTLDSVVSALTSLGRNVDDVYPLIHRLLRTKELEPSATLQKLAAITDFRLFVSLSFDALLQQAIDKVRFGGDAHATSISYSPNLMPDCDLPAPLSRLASPTVFHLLGKHSPLPEFAISDEDLLEHLIGIQSNARPSLLLDELKANSLLILGGTLPDWLIRFLLRVAKQQRLSSPRERREVFEILADSRKSGGKTRLITFLSSYSARTSIFPGDADTFVQELWQRWTDRKKVQGPPETQMLPPRAQPFVFVSYAREDRAAADAIVATLRSHGVSIWFDESHIEPGDSFADEIRSHIASCALFMPLISRNTEARIRDAYFRREWLQACKRDETNDRGVRFIVPIVIDDSKVTDLSRVPEQFLDRHILEAPGGVLPPAAIRAIRSTVAGS